MKEYKLPIGCDVPEMCIRDRHVGMTNIPYQSDLEYLKGYSEDLGVPFVHYETFRCV